MARSGASRGARPGSPRWLAAAVWLAGCTPPAPAPHALPFDPLPAVGEEATAPLADDAGDGTERLARWVPPYAPRLAAEVHVTGGVLGPIVLRPGDCPARRAGDCACDDDLMLVGSTGGVLTAFDVDGNPRWEYACGTAGAGPSAAPAAEPVFLRCGDGAVVALDPGDGHERWRVARSARDGLVGAFEWSPWAGMLFAGDDGLVALHRSGAVAWTWPEPGPFPGRPALSGRVVVFAGLDRIVRGYDAGTGEELWRRWVVGGVEGGVLELENGDVVVATLYGHVHAFGMPDGVPRWETTVGTLARGSPVEGTDGTILVGLMDGALVGLAPEDGAVAWGLGVPAPILAAPLVVERIDAGGGPDAGAAGERAGVVIADRDGYLAEVSYRARGAGGASAPVPPEELWRFNVGLPIEARPTLEGASLLVGLEDGRVVRIVPGEPQCGDGE
ncbi:MAG: PQQ-binding-like beta-propeller repeat protein [Deltaproteobacteria bacterium]|nr:PQQ-binding-like beta-propeller repeat protein [Deltaproteobacteria bacterium]